MDLPGKRIWRPLAADIRQAIVGWVVLLALLLVGALLLASLAGEVPAWSLAAVLAIATVLIAAISLEHRRELGRVEGSLDLEKKHREALEKELKDAERRAGSQSAEGNNQGFLFRIQALREEVIERRDQGFVATDAQEEAVRHLALDVRDRFGASPSLDAIIEEWERRNFDFSSAAAATALGQLEGIVIGATQT